MIEFLKNHERYWTMNSWNGSSSYANNVKIYNLGMDHDLEMKAYGLLAEEGFNQLLASDYEFLTERKDIILLKDLMITASILLRF